MESQSYVDWGFRALVIAACGIVWKRQESNREAIETLRVNVAGNYVTHQNLREVKEAVNRIEADVKNGVLLILERLDRKADK